MAAWQLSAVGNLKLSLPHFTPFSPKRGWLRPQSSHYFFSQLPSPNENPEGFIRLI